MVVTRKITIFGRRFWIMLASLGVFAFIIALSSGRSYIKFCLLPLSILLTFVAAIKIKENEHVIVVRDVVKKNGGKNLRMGSNK